MIEWFNATIDAALAGWREVPSKDALSLGVSLCALVIAFVTFAYTIRSKRREATTAARNDLHACVWELAKLRTEREEKERELGDKLYSAEHAPTRARFNNKTKLYLSKAVLLSTKYRKVDLSSFESLLLGAALADEGKYRASLQFYQRAVKTSADAADKAAALRVYGRALIASGRPRWGRWRMRKAAKLFAALGGKRGYDDDKMNYESAETYGLLLRTQLRCNYRKKTRADLLDFRRSIAAIKDPRTRQILEEQLAEMTGLPRPPTDPAPAPAPTPAPASTPAPALSPAADTVTSEASPHVTAPDIAAPISPADDDARQGSLSLAPAEIRAP